MDPARDDTLSKSAPMGVVDALDTAMALYRRHFVRLTTVSAVVAVPVNVAMVAASSVLGLDALISGTGGSDAPAGAPDFAVVLGSLAVYGTLGILASLAYVLQYAALVESSSSAYLGRPSGLKQAYSVATQAFARLLGTWLLVGVLVAAAMMVLFLVLFAVVGVTVAASGGSDIVTAVVSLAAAMAVTVALLGGLVAVSAFLPQVVVLERLAYVDALRRHAALIRGGTLRVIGGVLLLWMVAGLFQMAFVVSTAALVSEVVLPLVGAGWQTETIATNVISSIVSLFLQPFVVTALTVFYYSRRSTNEALDMLWSIDMLAMRRTKATT